MLMPQPTRPQDSLIWDQFDRRLIRVREELGKSLPAAMQLIAADNVTERFENRVLKRLAGNSFDAGGMDWGRLKAEVRGEFHQPAGSWMNNSTARILDSVEFLLNRITADCVDEVISHSRNLGDIEAAVGFVGQNMGKRNMAELSLGTLLALQEHQKEEVERSRRPQPKPKRPVSRLEELPHLTMAHIFPSELIRKYEMSIRDDPKRAVEVKFASKEYGLEMTVTAPHDKDVLSVDCEVKKDLDVGSETVVMFALKRARDIATITGRELLFNGRKVDIAPNESLTLTQLTADVAEYARVMRETEKEREWHQKARIKNIKASADVQRLADGGGLVRLLPPEQTVVERGRNIGRGEFFEVVCENPYVSPHMAQTWEKITTTYVEKLRGLGLDPAECRLRVTSAVRSQERQAELVAEGYPAALLSSHTKGEAMDVYFKWLAENKPKHAEALMETLRDMALRNEINYVIEHQKAGDVLHIARNPASQAQ